MKNILNALKGGFAETLVNEVLDSRKSKEEMIDEIAHRVIHEPLENRTNNSELTGEWIVFAKYNQCNYYLCLSTHDAGDQIIFDKINEFCKEDFPFLSDLFA